MSGLDIYFSIGNNFNNYYNTDEIAVHKISSKKLNYNKEHYTELLSNVLNNIDDISELADSNLKQMDEFL